MLLFSDGQTGLHLGDTREVLRGLPAESIQTCVTSPPYWPLRNYHLDPVTWDDGWTGVLGVEPDPQMYADHLVEVMREVRRVLHPTGTLWLNIGDSWAGSGGAHKPYHANPGISRSDARAGLTHSDRVPHWGDLGQPVHYLAPKGMKAGDLIGAPWLVAEALRSDGWYLRQDNIWAKKNGQPESVMGPRWEQCRIKVKVGLHNSERVIGSMPSDLPEHHPGQVPRRSGSFSASSPTEWALCPGCPKCLPHSGYILRWANWRPTKAHEYIFLLTKTDRSYADYEAVKQPIAESSQKRLAQETFWLQQGGPKDYSNGTDGTNGSRSSRKTLEHLALKGSDRRNLRSVWMQNGGEPSTVWEFPVANYGGDHFAVFPETLPELCIRAGTPEGGVCGGCGSPWARVIERTSMEVRFSGNREAALAAGSGNGRTDTRGTMTRAPSSETLGWLPTCDCPFPPVPATVLDPFVGSGTTCAVAKRLGRKSIGIDANLDYLMLAHDRVEKTQALNAI